MVVAREPPSVGENNMNAKRSQPQIICFLLSLIAALCFLMLGGSAASNAQEKSDISIVVADVCGDKEIDKDGRFNADTYIDNQQITNYGLPYPPGQHELRVVTLPPSGEEGKYVVKEIKLLKGGVGQPTQRYTPNTAEAKVTFTDRRHC